MFIIFYYLFTFTFSISTFSFFYFLYQQIYQYKKKEKEEEQPSTKEIDEKPEIKYEDKYLSEWKNLLEKTVIEQKSYAYLKNNFVMEKTPIGNVAMCYDEETETFSYYSDNTIPYRFLEVIARKYVITFHCALLFIDMEKELKRIELKKMEEKKLLLEEEEEKKMVSSLSLIPEKKNVFTKFKSYNKEGMSGRVNNAPAPKNSISTSNSSKNNSNILMKDNANRYLCKGRFSNFPILQKVNRKKIDKEYAMTFSEYKKKLITGK